MKNQKVAFAIKMKEKTVWITVWITWFNRKKDKKKQESR